MSEPSLGDKEVWLCEHFQFADVNERVSFAGWCELGNEHPCDYPVNKDCPNYKECECSNCNSYRG